MSGQTIIWLASIQPNLHVVVGVTVGLIIAALALNVLCHVADGKAFMPVHVWIGLAVTAFIMACTMAIVPTPDAMKEILEYQNRCSI